jgi:basic amino acid/polyamine antiporter, APA family
LLGERAAEWAAVGVMCSAFGAVNSNMLTGPRIYFAMARDGLLPRFIDRVHHRYETPHNAILLQCVWTLLLIVVVFRVTDKPRAAFDTLTNYVIFGGYIFYNMAVAAVFVLRRKRPDLPRPYRTWGYPVTPALYTVSFGIVLVNMLIDSSTRYSSLAGLSLIAAGVPFYLWMRRRDDRAARPPAAV